MAESTPTYILAAVPEQPNRVRNLFHLGPEPSFVSGVLENPGSFRYAGWDLQTLDQAHIRNGEYLELRNGPRKTLRLYEDGTFLVRGEINGDFLGWAVREGFEKNPRVHSLAMIEFTTAFTYLYCRILPFLEYGPKHIRFHIEIANGKVGDRFLYLIPSPVNSIGWMTGDDKYALTKENPMQDEIVATDDLRNDPGSVAFRLTERLFLFFDVAGNNIPYTVEKEGVRRVNVEQIKSIR